MNRRLEKFCPQCGEDITDTYELIYTWRFYTAAIHCESTGGFSTRGVWYCDTCELPIDELETHA